MAGVRCVTYCNLYSLDSSQFETVLDSYPLMRRTMESVAAERLNKLGKNPSIISTRHDLKRDAAVLKDMIDRATPLPSSGSSSNDASLASSSSSSSSSASLNEHRRTDFKSSISHLHQDWNRFTGQHHQHQHSHSHSHPHHHHHHHRHQQQQQQSSPERQRRKSSSQEKNFKKLSRLFLAAPQATLNPPNDENKNPLRKSPSTPWSLFRKGASPSPSFSHQASS